MSQPIVLLAIPGSALAKDIGSELMNHDSEYCILSLDAPLEDKPVTVSSRGVDWEGVDLLRAGAILVESPIFPWPQSLPPPDPYRSRADFKFWSEYQREARALAQSAVTVAAQKVPIINHPQAVHFAVSPAMALDRLRSAGIAVHPWRLSPAGDAPWQPEFWLDAMGRDRWQAPQRDPAGASRLAYAPCDGELLRLLVVGNSPVGALRYENAGFWARRAFTPNGESAGRKPERVSAAALPAVAGDLAVQTSATLGLDLAAVTIAGSTSSARVVYCEAAPDLAAWNSVLAGRVAAALAERLAAAAAAGKGARP